MLSNKYIKKFNEDGFLHLKNFFSEKFILEIRKYILDKYIDGTKEYYVSNSDLLSDQYLKKIILNDNLIELFKNILGENVVYFGESCWTCSHGKTNPMAYHTDNSDRDNFGKDWEVENYPIVRFAFYLQDHSRQGGGPLIGLKSHKNYIKNLYLRVLFRETLGPIMGRYKYIPYKIGDLLIWNLRTTHAGDGLKFKFSNFPISKRLNKYIPDFLISRCKEERFLINGNFASESFYLDKYINYLKTRTYQVSRWNNMTLDEDTINELAKKNVKYKDVSKNIKQDIIEKKIDFNELHLNHKDYK